ncbi:MAG: Uma2 family endonuclease [Hormoscilla sp. GM102CHS1]|nr:Uma2 family endonuclease [Hormoscilla sp. GM102CHS1]
MIATLTTPRSFDEFVDWYPENATGKYELHNGAIVKMPLGTGEHSSVIGFIAGELHFEIRQSQLPCAIPGECLLKPFHDKSGYQPDIIVLNKAQLASEPRWQKESIITKGDSVRLAIEVASTNWLDDYLLKAWEYELMGIPEYWIVDYLGLGPGCHFLLRDEIYFKSYRRFIGDPNQPTLAVYQLVDGKHKVTLFIGNDRIESLAFPELQLSIFAAKTITDS